VSNVRKLSSLGSKSLAHRKGRSILTGTGIVLGVAIFFGVLVSNATTQKGVDNLIESFTGRSDVVAGPVGAFDANLPAGTVDKLRTLPDVREVVGGYAFGTALADHPSKDDPTEPTRLNVAGIVPAEAKKIRDFPILAGRFAQPGRDEIAVSRKVADDLGVHIGDRLTIRGRKLARPLTIVGILDTKEVGGFNEARGSAYTSIETARTLQGDPPGTFSGAAIILAKGVDADDWIETHRGAVPGVRLQNSDTLAEGFKQFLTIFGTFLTFFAAITLFVGAFLIYLTLSMAVIERTRMYGTLRALGATAKQVRRVVMREALALGAVSILAGLALGLVLALGLLALIGKLFQFDVPGLQIKPGAIIATIIVGAAVTAFSALIPARRAGRLQPIEAMKGDYARDTRLGRMWIVGAVVFVLSVALFLSSNSPAAGSSVIGILLGAVLLVPLLLRPVSRLLGRLTNRLARGVGDIAVLHLAKERSRSAYTLALVMVVMAMLFATGGLYLSLRTGIDKVIDRQFGADLFVQPRTPDDGTLQAKLAASKDVERVTAIRFGIATAYDKQNKREELFVRTIEPDSYFAVASYFWKDGNDTDAKAALARGGSVLVAADVARQLDKSVGDDLTFETTKGNHSFRIAAIYIGAAGPPEVSMGVTDARTYLTAARPIGYAMNVRPGATPGGTARELKKALPAYQLETQSAADVKDQVRGQFLTFFQIIYAILLLAAIVGLLGLANTLAMSVLQRFREIGILRAIGVTRSQAWRMVLVESLTMGLTALVLSLPLGLLLTYLIVRSTSIGFGFTIATIYPWVWIPFVALFGIFVAVVAAIAPGRRAAKLQVVSALQYE
jgi:putative ABC transport system permease protein